MLFFIILFSIIFFGLNMIMGLEPRLIYYIVSMVVVLAIAKRKGMY